MHVSKRDFLTVTDFTRSALASLFDLAVRL